MLIKPPFFPLVILSVSNILPGLLNFNELDEMSIFGIA